MDTLIRKEKQKQLYEPQQRQPKEDYSDDHDGAAVKHGEAHEKQRRAVQGLIRQVEQVKLAATAISLNVRMRSSSNMPHHMQDRALRRTRSLLDSSTKQSSAFPKTRPNPTHLARALKKEFDSLYGPAWHCVVGKSFGSFVTHSPGGFLYFSIDDSLSVLLFKTEVQLVAQQQQQAIAKTIDRS